MLFRRFGYPAGTLGGELALPQVVWLLPVGHHGRLMVSSVEETLPMVLLGDSEKYA